MSSSTPAPYVLILIDLAVEAGVARHDLLQGSSLAGADLSAIGARVSDDDFRTLVENTLRLTGDPALGLRLGRRLNLSAHAVLGQAFMTCRNLEEVIQLFEHYYPVLAPELTLEFSRTEDRLLICSPNSEAYLPISFGLECITAAIRNTLTGLLGDTQFPLRFEFPYPAPAHAAVYTEVLGDDVYFDCEAAVWSFPLELLDTPLPSSNPALRQLYEAECARLLADLSDSAAIGEQTRSLLRKLEGQYPKMPQVATMLNMSPRTYRRRLTEEGVSFQALLDEVRAEHATRHLRERRLPIASIAYQLGFNDPSNFRRAYRRWTGVTPGAVRNKGDEAQP
ncbi:AraC family transcriptional regulator [Congregibacter litoralis]|uniref:Transcriptional regulator, AraC family n=1 Tax=Congregibacter litoralis KT71 TaxID=314285 RepID=A4A9K9_9GAMM|nr:AraC family transcriptional regulator [Congregibacter litoralis]EAQ97176.1 transcriptional regulator, AraC family [Congregibacter litoralis KT71]